MRRGATRKGMMYTIVVIILLLVIINIFFTQSRAYDRGSAAGDRIRTVNSFIHDLEQDSGRAAYIAGFRTLVAMEQHITSTGVPIDEPEEVFREIFLGGSYNATEFIIMQDSTFSEYLARVQSEAGTQGIQFNATVTNISLWQTDPWHLLVNYTMEANITDSRGTASWTITRTFFGKIPIVDLRDPLITVQTYGRLQQVIKPSNASQLVIDATNDTAALLQHMNVSYYIAAGRGPDILMRFAGNMSDSEFGIESLIDTDELIAQGLPADSSASIVDYQYFAATAATICNVQNLPARMRFSAADAANYELDELEYSACQ